MLCPRPAPGRKSALALWLGSIAVTASHFQRREVQAAVGIASVLSLDRVHVVVGAAKRLGWCLVGRCGRASQPSRGERVGDGGPVDGMIRFTAPEQMLGSPAPWWELGGAVAVCVGDAV